MNNWLGTEFLSFQQARAFARCLGLNSVVDWRDYCNSGRKPTNVPSSPQDVYADQGWISIGDWLGTGRVSTKLRRFRSFKEARAFARGLGLKSIADWRAYCGSGKKPHDIPVHPYGAYAKDGWSNWSDWLGTATVASYLREYRSFKEARDYVRSLGLTKIEWPTTASPATSQKIFLQRQAMFMHNRAGLA
jgi:hypothetical protein